MSKVRTTSQLSLDGGIRERLSFGFMERPGKESVAAGRSDHFFNGIADKGFGVIVRDVLRTTKRSVRIVQIASQALRYESFAKFADCRANALERIVA